MSNIQKANHVLMSATAALLFVACGGEAGAGEGGNGQMAGVDEGQPVMLERTAVFDEPLGAILGVRERADGSVLLADPLGKVLLQVDMDAGTADTLGAEGEGPQEYGQPDAVWALDGDRSLLVDLGNSRLTEVLPDGSFGDTWPLTAGTPGPPGAGTPFEVRLPEGVDEQGRVYYQGRVMMAGEGELPTEAPLRRWDPSTDTVDELAMLGLPERETSSSGGSNNRSFSIRPIPLSPQDAFAVGPDGAVAIVRAEPYRVEWIRPDGSRVEGPAVVVDPVPIGRDEQLAWMDRSAATGGGIAVAVSIDNGAARTNLSRGGAMGMGGAENSVDDYTWPETMPAFVSGEVTVGPDRTVWVRRSGAAENPPVYDVFDAEGRLTGQVGFELGRRVIGFGDGVVYAVRFDEFDVPTLERYALP